LTLLRHERRRRSPVGSQDAGSSEGTGGSLRPVWRATDGCRAVAGHNQSYDVWVAGELSPRRLGRAEGEASFWLSTKAGRQETEMDLRNGDAEESAATQI